MKLHYKLITALISGAVLGVILFDYKSTGWLTTLANYITEPFGQIFLRLIFMIVVPMVFSGLVLGVFQLAQNHNLGSIAKKTFIFTFVASSASVIIGVALVDLIKPGKNLDISAITNTDKIEQIKTNVENAKPAMQSIIEIIPKNPLQAATEAMNGEMLSFMFFSLIFGWALSRSLSSKNESHFKNLLEEVYSGCLYLVEQVMKFAPFAVFCLVFNSISKFGVQIIFSLLAYVGVVILALLIQQFGTYTLLLKFFSNISPLEFYKKCKDVYIYAFATASSNATLPKSLELAETKLNLNPAASRFVLTIGSTANQNGTALFEGITVLFLAQAYNIDLSTSQQLQVVLMSILAGIGTAGVPGGSLPLIMILLNQMGIPAEGIGIILGVDRLLDMCRTTVNVSGDLVIAALVGHQKPNNG